MASTVGNQCVRQIATIRKDILTLSTSTSTQSTPLKGQISHSLSTLSRLLEDFENLLKSEINPQKRDRGLERLAELRKEYGTIKVEYEAVNRRREGEEIRDTRGELLGRRTGAQKINATPENPYSGSPVPTRMSREQGNIHESDKLGQVGASIDGFIEVGLVSLADLRDQSSTLKSSQRKLRDVANSMGLSRDTIRFIERRTSGDKVVFYGGCVVTLVLFFLILRYFG